MIVFSWERDRQNPKESKWIIPVLKVVRSLCVDYGTHRIPTKPDWQPRQLVTKCRQQSWHGCFLVDRCRHEKVLLSLHRSFVWFRFDWFQHGLKSLIHPWLVWRLPVAPNHGCFLWFRALDKWPNLSIVFARNRSASILDAYDPFQLSIDLPMDTMNTETKPKNQWH